MIRALALSQKRCSILFRRGLSLGPLARSTAIAVVLLVLAVFLWWDYTIISVLLVVFVIYICVGGCCRSASVTDLMRPSRRSRREGLWDIVDRGYRNAFEKSIEIEAADIPGMMDPRMAPYELPIEIIPGISTGQSGRLREMGIEILLDLADGNPEDIALACETEVQIAEEWKTDAIVIIYGGEIENLVQLGTYDAAALKVKIDFAIESREISVPQGYEASEEKIRDWIAAAKDEMIRLGIDSSDDFFDEP
ncbi:MAG: hypothetical protein JSW61_03890 [Candidatus Thorarchaeota archaeon]|nr:MAG: hypothetical protein JSW61_03890 [Candidatus Thorarchaeota archaeon]